MDLDRSFGFLLNDVARLFGRRFSHHGGRLGLTRAQCRILGYLARNEGINQAGLADRLEVSPMTLVRQIDRMEEAGWIERRPNPADRRARRLFLTGKARPVLGRIWDVANETRDEALAGLAPAERLILVKLLDRVHATLSERVPADAGSASDDPAFRRDRRANPGRRSAGEGADTRPPSPRANAAGPAAAQTAAGRSISMRPPPGEAAEDTLPIAEGGR